MSWDSLLLSNMTLLSDNWLGLCLISATQAGKVILSKRFGKNRFFFRYRQSDRQAFEWQKTFWTPLIILLTLCDVGPNDARLVWFLKPSSVSTATTLHSAQMTLECQGEPNWCLLNCYRVVNRYLYLSIEEIILVFKMAKEERAIEIEDPWS